ncbi:MAG: transcription elongation factor GreA [Patescibacteria group bacterium]
MNLYSKKLQLTKTGYQALHKELEELESVKRPKVVDRLSNARKEGDLAENSDYSSAKEELEFLDGRIQELTGVLNQAVVVNGGAKGSVGVGTRVTLKMNGDENMFEIVGEWEADPVNKKISHESPLGKALVGKKVGDKVGVEAPAGKLTYEILAIG